MIWTLVIIAAIVLTLLGTLEWRSWKKPLSPGLDDGWGGANRYRGSDRPLTGGSNFDEPHN
jgi:hypothetical protein